MNKELRCTMLVLSPMGESTRKQPNKENATPKPSPLC
jgi:hypothetical protein